jgi:hypothetical protein
MFINSIFFYSYGQIENNSLSSNFSLSPEFKFSVNFFFSPKEKKKLLQTSDLMIQFFISRPKVISKKKMNKLAAFNVSITPNFFSLFMAFRVAWATRNSIKKKLITFTFKANGDVYLIFKDFVTLYPFTIKNYDFHDWRNQFVMFSPSSLTSKNSEFFTYSKINFFINFFLF